MSAINAIVAAHDTRRAEWLKIILKERGYNVDVVTSLAEMEEETKKDNYQIYMMDLNLGFPGDLDITPAQIIYDALEHRIEKMEVAFIGFSYNRQTVDMAHQANIPACGTNDFDPPDHEKTIDLYVKDLVLN